MLRAASLAFGARSLVRIGCARWLLGLFSLAVQPALGTEDDGSEATPWVESELALPGSSRLVRPVFVDLGALTENAFAVDAGTLVLGADGVVRFTLQVVSPSGAATVTYEGIRCDTKELRRYATGRTDGTWARARTAGWQRIRATSINSYSSVLARDYFCPGGVVVQNSAEAIRALERGGLPGSGLRP